MPIRARSHILEEESVRRFADALPAAWVYRSKAPDYGIDGEVEIFEASGKPCGVSFNVQLRATDDLAKIDSVRLEVDELAYYSSLDVPTIVVRYGSPEASLYWQWASNIVSRVEIAEGQKTVTYRFNESERWTDETAERIFRTLKVRRIIANFPPGMAMPLRIDLSEIPKIDRYVIDRTIARAISASRGSLIRAGSAVSDIETLVRLKPAYLSVEIDALFSVTFDLQDPTPEDYLSSILYALAHLFRQQRLVRQAEAISVLLLENGLSHHSKQLAFDACIALKADLSALVRLALMNDLHHEGPFNPLIALTIARAPHAPEVRRAAIESFFHASLIIASDIDPEGGATTHYCIGNFYRNNRDELRAVHHYNIARRLRPAYLQADYFAAELAGSLFLAKRYRLSCQLYEKAVRLDTDDKYLIARLGDARLFSGEAAEARICFNVVAGSDADARLIREAKLKAMICDSLCEEAASGVIPRRRSDANRLMSPDGTDTFASLENIVREVDALQPLARFNLGVTYSRQMDHAAAFYNFLLCSFIQPQDIVAWANAAICALGLSDADLLYRVMGTAIQYMGAEAYDHFRAELAAQGITPDSLEALDGVAMEFLEERAQQEDDAFTLRLLDGDEHHVMTVYGAGNI